ncbi:hypothetical protein V496_05614 [Pseudogymnoascus sp. VKM F-4515 (FW-2607)]|nr:hypothetical protein V496_05614 [Pseudogymnoascus sp. VKM F-4515 (FW-2607)]
MSWLQHERGADFPTRAQRDTSPNGPRVNSAVVGPRHGLPPTSAGPIPTFQQRHGTGEQMPVAALHAAQFLLLFEKETKEGRKVAVGLKIASLVPGLWVRHWSTWDVQIGLHR